jgi:signal transduction histidine kinase
VLTRTLDALVQESDPERLLEHVLRVIVEQADAHSVSVWERDQDATQLHLKAVLQNNRFQLSKPADYPVSQLPSTSYLGPIWSEILRKGQHAVLEGIDQPIARMCLGSGPDARWLPATDESNPDSATLRLQAYLRDLGIRSILFVPMLLAGEVVAVMAIRFSEKRIFLKKEIELTRALAQQAMLALQLTRLSAQNRESVLLAERNRMARDIHDTLAQGLTGVIVQLEAVEEAMSKNQAAKVSDHLNRAGDLARESLREARRSVQALRPQALEEKPLNEALKDLIERMTGGTTVQAEFTLRGEPRELPVEWEANILRIGQEVLTNVLRHARASEFKVLLGFDSKEIRLEMRDNGCGFEPRKRHEGFGLQGMRERAEGMGGQLTIQSAAGQGTAISIVLPVANAAELEAL